MEVVGRTVEYARTPSTGSALTHRLARDDGLAGVDALGARGTSAEAVRDEVVDAARNLLESDDVVDANMADQLLVFLAIAGGRITIPTVTAHVPTSLPLLAQSGYDVRIERTDGRVWVVA